MMCLPGGASDGSYIVGMVSSSSGRSRRAAVLGVVPGALDVLDARADVHGGPVLRARRAGIAP